MDAIQERRQATISLGLGGDKVELERLEVVERMSELFVIVVDCLSKLSEIDFLKHLGKPATIDISERSLVRTFHGLLLEAVFLEQTGAGFHYRLTLRPWLYLLGNNLDYRIFQDKSALDIIKEIFELRGCSDVDYSKLSNSLDTREYCVQFRESDLTFVSRLMEEEGIYYYFVHSEDRHTLVLCDSRSSHDVATGYDPVAFCPPGEAKVRYEDHIWQWNERISSTAQSTTTLRDYDFKKPDTVLEASHEGAAQHPRDAVEIYDYPGNFLETSLGSTRSQMILESHRAPRRTYFGEGDTVGMACGKLFSLARHETARFNQEYLVIGLTYRVQAEQFRSGSPDFGYEALVGIEAIPASIHFRAPFRTPKPVARGPETAVVTGPEGEVIYTDEYGRVKVQFHWDRQGEYNERSSCWIRVSHPWAGQGFGQQSLPRIKQEVIVDFLDGDPDRPIVTGRVHNASRQHAYGLPDNKTRSLWRTETVGESGDYDGAEHSPPGGPGSNEIRFEDKGGAEEVYVHAQRDMNTVVQLDQTLAVERDQSNRIGRDCKTEVKRNDSLTVEDGDQTHKVKTGKRTTTIHDDDTLTVEVGNRSITVQQGNMDTTISMGNLSSTVSQGKFDAKVKQDHTTKVSDGNMGIDIQKGDYSLKTDLGKVTIEAMQSIELKVGQNSVKIDQTGVTVNGMMIKLEAQVQLSAKGLISQVNGDAMLQLKGGVTMIN